ncbi:MAG: SEC-C metal-binding domain-containing protein, partial [Patescibacteria group bacterium]
NEIISEFLKRKGVPHNVLNAKNHLREALIITEAGKRGAVTVATNMAGRGVDIILGGSKKEKWEIENEKEWEREMKEWQKRHEEVVSLGGLHVIGTERHESRRIDNQLRGRSGRQGDPGTSRFYVALEDDIMRLFGGDQVARLMTIFKLPEDVPLEHSMVSKAIEQAQVKVEGFHFDSRKHLVEYDDVLNKQREIVYRRRRKILEGQSQKEAILEKISGELAAIVGLSTGEREGSLDRAKIIQEFCAIIPFDDLSQKNLLQQLEQMQRGEEVVEFLTKLTVDMYEAREKQLTGEVMRQVERWVSLGVIDSLWMEHLDAIDDLREGIGLRGYGQRDPLVEYKNEAFTMFERLIATIDSEIVHRIFKVQVQLAPPQQVTSDTRHVTSPLPQTPPLPSVRQSQANVSGTAVVQPKVTKKLGRNDPCPCGSGKKYKKCHYPQYG